MKLFPRLGHLEAVDGLDKCLLGVQSRSDPIGIGFNIRSPSNRLPHVLAHYVALCNENVRFALQEERTMCQNLRQSAPDKVESCKERYRRYSFPHVRDICNLPLSTYPVLKSVHASLTMAFAWIVSCWFSPVLDRHRIT